MNDNMVLMPTAVEMVDRTAWLAERRLGVGGSEVSAVYSDKPFGCRKRLWYEKLGIEIDFQDEYNVLLDYGLYLEPWIRARFQQLTGRTVVSRETIVDPKLPWHRANLDGVITEDPNNRAWIGEKAEGLALGEAPAMYEAKSVNTWYFEIVKNQGLRADHIRQGTWNGGLLHSDWGSFAVQNRDSSAQLTIDFRVDRDLNEMMIDAVGKFWTVDVEMKREPEPLKEIDDRCRTCPWRRTCRGDVNLGAMDHPDDSNVYEFVDSENIHTLAVAYEKAQEVAKEAEVARKTASAALIETLIMRMPDGSIHRERDRVLTPQGDKITHAWRSRGSWDSDALKTAPPYLYTLPEHREAAIKLLEDAGIEVTTADLKALYYRENPHGGGRPLLVSHPKPKKKTRRKS